MITLLVAGVLLITVASGGNAARACDGCNGGNCNGGFGLFGHYQPAVTYYAPIPLWWPNYFGAPYSDYQVVHYMTPPAVSAEIVKERIAAINATNPVMLPMPQEPLPLPKGDGLLPPADKVAPPKK